MRRFMSRFLMCSDSGGESCTFCGHCCFIINVYGHDRMGKNNENHENTKTFQSSLSLSLFGVKSVRVHT